MNVQIRFRNVYVECWFCESFVNQSVTLSHFFLSSILFISIIILFKLVVFVKEIHPLVIYKHAHRCSHALNHALNVKVECQVLRDDASKNNGIEVRCNKRCTAKQGRNSNWVCGIGIANDNIGRRRFASVLPACGSLIIARRLPRCKIMPLPESQPKCV